MSGPLKSDLEMAVALLAEAASVLESLGPDVAEKSPGWRWPLADELGGAASILRDCLPQFAAPIDMVLHCPKCHTQHIDAPESPMRAAAANSLAGLSAGGLWTNPPHRSHLCHQCGTIWRPADVWTNGVASIATRGKNDTWGPA